MNLVLLFLLCGSLNADQEFRVWKDATGKFSVEAKVVENKNGTVTLEKSNGNQIKVPLNKLSSADKKYLRELTRQKYGTGKTAKTENSTSTVSPTTATSSADDSSDSGWPSWRGSDRSGISPEKGLLQSWTDQGPEQLWTADGIGKGMSSLVIADGKIYTLGVISGQQSMVCVSNEGKVLWSTPFAGSGEPNCTPTYDNGMVYGLSRDGILACVDTSNGKVVWKVDFAKDFGGKMMSGWGYSESPLVDGDRLICTPGGEQAMMVALNKKTGAVIWKTPMRSGGNKGQDGAGYASVVISNAAGIKQYITLVGRGVIGVDAESGRPLWQYERVANGTANVPTPIVEGDYVFCSSGYNDGGSALLELRKQGRGIAVREVYYLKANEVQNHHGGMVLIDGHVYMGNGHNKGFPLCLDMRTGKVKWGGRMRGPGDGSAAIVAADGQLYFRYEDGKMALIEVNPMKYQLNGKFNLPIKNGKSWPHPVVCDGKLYIRCQHQLACFDIKQN